MINMYLILLCKNKNLTFDLSTVVIPGPKIKLSTFFYTYLSFSLKLSDTAKLKSKQPGCNNLMLPEAEALSVQLKSKHELRKKHCTVRKQSVSFYSAVWLSYTLLDQVFSSISLDQDFYEKVIPGVGFQSPLLVWIKIFPRNLV